MRIWIISSWNDTLSLFAFLNHHEHEYFIIHDQTFFPYWTKNFAFIIEQIKHHIKTLKEKGVEKILLDPIYELFFLNDWSYQNDLFPLFSHYLHHEVLPHSLVGKIGILTDPWSHEIAQNLFESQIKDFQLTPRQQSTKKFHFPFCYRVKSATPRMEMIQTLWVHNPFLIKTMKNDLRYFKDTAVDLFIPLHYRMFQMQRSINSFFNAHKTRFYGFSFLEKSFCEIVQSLWGAESSYKVTIFTTQHEDFFWKEKKLVWLISKWCKDTIHIESY